MDDGTHGEPWGDAEAGDVSCWCFVLRAGMVHLLDLLWFIRR